MSRPLWHHQTPAGLTDVRTPSVVVRLLYNSRSESEVNELLGKGCAAYGEHLEALPGVPQSARDYLAQDCGHLLDEQYDGIENHVMKTGPAGLLRELCVTTTGRCTRLGDGEEL